MSEVLHGNNSDDQLNVNSDKTQVYGLKGNDTLISDGKSDVLLIGGSGEDSLVMKGGKGSLSGGAGADTFEFHYSATETISAVIEDFDPSSDKIVVNFDGDTAPQLTSVKSGNDVVWRSSDGKFNLTLKSVRDNDYFDGDAPEQVWEVLKLTNDEREKLNLPALTLSEGLMTGASIRAEEITEKGKLGLLTDHKRPNGESYKTVLVDEDLSLEQKYHSYAENLQAGAELPEDVMEDWMNSKGHRKNILDVENNGYRKLGVGYNYDADSDRDHQYHYWTQLFADSIKSPETVSTDELLTAQIDTSAASKRITLTKEDNTCTNTAFGATINAREGNDSITNTGTNVSISGGKGNDTIDNSGSFVTIKAGTGNDYIRLSNDSKENLIQYKTGDGNDTISGFHATDTLSISADEYNPVTIGNDIIVSVGTDSITLADAATLSPVIDGTRSKLYILTENADTLNNTVDGATIMALGGNDSIRNDGANVLFVYESGQDTIRGFNETSTLKVSEGIACSSLDSGKDIILNLDTGSVKILGAASLNALNILDTNDNPVNVSDARNIVGAETADNLNNSIDGATIQALGGDDTITNSGNKVSIIGGEGSDSISNSGNRVSIVGGEGSDYISSSGNRVSIVGGEGSDYISSSGSNVSIDAGAGNDTISLEGNKRNLINYNSSDGNDVIEGFNEKSTLQIDEGEGNYSSIKSGDDIIVTVDDSSITLTGAATLETINIDGEEIIPEEEPLIPYDAVKYNGHSYYLFDEGMTWEEAKAYCEARGGHLAVITDAGEQAAIQSLLEEKGTKNSYWLGGYLPADTGNGGSGEIAVSLQQNVSYVEYSLGDSVTIGGGDDDSKFITLTEGDDTRSNSIEGATIQALGGNDYITNESLGANTSINGGDGKDTIDNNSSNVTINGDDGNDDIYSNGDSVTIDAGIGNDYIHNESLGANTSISGGAGNDDIFNKGDSVLIDGGAGNDDIDNLGDFVTIDGGSEYDTIRSNGDSVTIDGGYGNDYIENSGKRVTINGGLDNDSIDNQGDTVAIDGGNGDDYIENSGNRVTIDGGAGADFVFASVGGFNNQIYGGDDNDTVRNLGDYATIYGGANDDSIENNSNYVVINGDAGDDTINSNAINSNGRLNTINGNEGSDKINVGGQNNAINGDEGNDSINVTGQLHVINGGSGNDSIFNKAIVSTINGGAEDDLISLNSSAINNLIKYASDDGNDTIYGFDGNDTLSISGDSYSSVTSGDDIVITVGDGSILLKDAASLGTIQIDGEEDTTPTDTVGVTINNTESNTLITGTNYADSIKNSGNNVTINALDGNDDLWNDGEAANVVISLGAGDDTTWSGGASSTITGDEGDDSIDNHGHHALIDGGAGNDTLYNYVGADDGNYPYEEANFSTILGGEGNDFIDNHGNHALVEGGAGDDEIKNYTGAWFDDEAEYSTILGGDGNDSIDNTANHVSIEGGDGADLINSYSEASYSTINGGVGDDSLSNDGSNVTMLGGKDDDIISLTSGANNNLIAYTSGDGNDTIYGFDGNDTLSISGGSYSTTKSGDDVVITVGDGSILIKDAASLGTIQIDGEEDTTVESKFITLTENPDSYSNTIEGATIAALGSDDSIENWSANVSISGGKGNDTLNNGGSNSSIDGGEGNDNIYSHAGSNNVTIDAGLGDDTVRNHSANTFIDAGAGNDSIYMHEHMIWNEETQIWDYVSSPDNTTIKGGDGDDTIFNNIYAYKAADNISINGGNGNDYVYNLGDSVTVDSGDDNDTIDNSGTNVTIDAGSGDDSVLSSSSYVSIEGGDGDDTIQNEVFGTAAAGSNNTISAGADNDFISSDGVNALISAGTGNDSILNYGANATVIAGDGNDSINNTGNNSDDSSNVSILGGAGDDTILNNSGSNVTIDGGTGNDQISLTDSTTNNLIAYASGDGNDTIYGFNSSSTLSISGGSYSSVKSGDDIVITVGDGSILLKDAASLGSIQISGEEDTTPTDTVGVTINNTLSNTLITGTNYVDSISNSGNNVTINALGDNDSIYNESMASNSSIDGGAGNDTIYNDCGEEVSISGGDGNDSIESDGNYVSISGDSGDDFIYNNKAYYYDEENTSGYKVTMNGGDGNDIIKNGGYDVRGYYNEGGKSVLINGGAGKDTVENTGSNVTIDGGKDDDIISLTSSATDNLIAYAKGDGKDTIYGFNSSSTLSISGGSYSSVKSGDDVVITVGDGSILLKDVTNLSTANIIGTLSDDSDSTDGWKWVTGEAWDYTNWGAGQPDGDGSALIIYSSEENGWALGDWNDISADGTQDTQTSFGKENIGFICEWNDAYDDKFITLTEDADPPYYNMLEGATIAALGGNDSLYNDTTNVSLNGGKDNDYIHNWGGNNVTINAGSGSDTVDSNTNNSTIFGGAGKDSILNHGAYVLVEAGGGNDTIECYMIDDTSSSYTTIRGEKGHDYIDNHGHHALIEGGTGNDTLLNYIGDDGGIHEDYEADYSTILGGDGEDSIVNQGDSVSIDGGDGDDDINNAAGSQVTIDGGLGNDTITNNGNNVSISGGEGDDTITNSGNKVSIIGGDGDDTISNSGDKATILGGAGGDYIGNSGKNVTIFGGTGNDQISLTGDSKNNFICYTNGNGNDTIWGSTQNDTINILADGWSSLRSGKNDLIIEVKSDGVVTGTILLVGAKKRPPHITLGESGTEGGTRGGDGNDSSSGRGGRGGNGDGRTSGGKSSNDGNDSDASGGESASGRSGRGTSSRGGNRDSNPATLPSNEDSNVDINYARRSLEGINIDGSFIPEEQQTSGGRYIYTGDNQTVSDYQSGEQIIFCTEYNGAFYDNAGNFNALSPTGRLTVQNAKDKIIDIDDYAGRPFVKAYAASNPGVLDGRGIAGFEIINGSSDSDTIYAGDGGSQLWGGTGNVTDVLFGGNGSDVFVSGKTQGSDSLLNVSSTDTVHFDDAKLSDIISAEEDNGVIAVRFNTGNTVTVQSSESLSGKFLLADGSAYRFNHSDKSWQTLPKTYTGGNQIVSNYQSGEQILFSPKYNGAFYDNAGNFNALSPTGSLVIQNAKDKIIDLRDSAGNPFVKAYEASNPGVIDGRGIAGFEVIKGSSGSDTIYAGDGGSQLWGGANSAADVLFGGNGSDVFVSGKTQGSDSLLNVSSADTVHFDDAKLSDIISAEEDNGFIAVKFNMGNTVTVQSSESLSGKFLLADGSAYRYDHSNKSWQTA